MAQYFYSGIVSIKANDRLVQRFQGIISGDEKPQVLLQKANDDCIKFSVNEQGYNAQDLFCHIQQFNEV